jgi:hypothetical protein
MVRDDTQYGSFRQGFTLKFKHIEHLQYTDLMCPAAVEPVTTQLMGGDEVDGTGLIIKLDGVKDQQSVTTLDHTEEIDPLDTAVDDLHLRREGVVVFQVGCGIHTDAIIFLEYVSYAEYYHSHPSLF